MRNVIIVLLVAAVVVLAGQKVMSSRNSGPAGVFEDFATAIIRHELAADTWKLTSGDAAKDFGIRLARELDKNWISSARRFKYSIESEQKSSDGREVTLSVSQWAAVDPLGTHSGFGTLPLEATYTAKMIQTEDGWKVSSFALVKMTILDGELTVGEDGKLRSIYGEKWLNL